MATITLEIDEQTIEAARECARARNTTLEDAMRRWLEEYSSDDAASNRRAAEVALATVRRLRTPTRGPIPRFTREEMHER